ncbi:helix-turn-helix domain-containing protein [Haloterrigena salifodinae]|uniref:Helix-turn-helix domain-containing protein n=1 Tax=Haloterrigena salifodinae TaxID=2675099 RepID=A0A8T8E4A6_9EURY|nr:helix-turn-helix domain-containing protein [Haloterrigena salifodinae]QRV16326.1 helix-turn-helix domain-containing protein [Haloterrigena salifodinae]
MSVIVEFTLDDEDFRLGQVLAEPPDMYIELERIVPTGSSLIPFLWVEGDDTETFEQRVSESEHVTSFTVLDRFDDWVLYRMEWKTEQQDVLEGLEASDAAVLEAYGNSGWTFRLRFPTHDQVSQFYNYCMEYEIPIDITRSYTLTERSDVAQQFDLSNEQREALVLALQRGYYDTPSDVTMSDLADELGISQQAVSNRIVRGTKKVFERTLR